MSNSRSDDIVAAKKDKKKTSWILFFVVFTLVFILIIYYFSEIKKEVILLTKVNPYWLIVAIGSQFLTYFLTALVYMFLIRTYEAKNMPGLWSLVKASIISLFINQTVPLASLSGNAFYFNFLSRFNISRDNIFSIILGELLIFYMAMEMVIIALLFSCIFIFKSLLAFKGTLIAGLIIYLLFGLVIILAGRKNMIGQLYDKILRSRIIKRVFRRAENNAENTAISIKDANLSAIFKDNKPAAARSFLFQVMIIAADASTLYVLFLGLGYPVSFFIVLLALISTKIISLIPFLPGALILYESSMSFFFADAGIPLAIAIVATLVYRLLSFWFPMPIGTFFYRKWLKDSSVQ